MLSLHQYLNRIKKCQCSYIAEAGLQQFIEFGGIGVLRNFCLKMDSTDKCWDRLLCRACTVLSQCSVSKPLPLEQESGPLMFTLPKDCQNIVVDGRYIFFNDLFIQFRVYRAWLIQIQNCRDKKGSQLT